MLLTTFLNMFSTKLIKKYFIFRVEVHLESDHDPSDHSRCILQGFCLSLNSIF